MESCGVLAVVVALLIAVAVYVAIELRNLRVLIEPIAGSTLVGALTRV